MNPFDLQGPEFLVFYIILGGALLLCLYSMRHSGEVDFSTPVNLTDPYEIAYLRGGTNELIRVATVGLIDRGLLAVNENRLKVADEAQAQLIHHPLEREILNHFRVEQEAASEFRNEDVRKHCDRYAASLKTIGLLPDDDAKQRQMRKALLAAGILWMIATVKAVVALQRGHYNLGFLGALAVLFGVFAFAVGKVKRTKRGDTFLEHMRTLLVDLPGRASGFVPQSNTNELLMLGAVFGLASVPSGVFPYRRQLYRKATAEGVDCGAGCGSDSGSSSGHSDGSSGGSSGDSGGSSCGGGGGGCGGCGG
jgi:uncharacterized protein (TIGR04222 family)